MKTTPTASTVSASEFGRLVNRSRTRIGQLIRSGVLPHHEGRLVIVEAIPRFVEHLDSLAKPSKGRERIEAARAEKLELENAALKRDLLPAEEVRRDVTRGFTELKSQLLTIPRRLAQPLAMETDAVIVEERMEKEILAVLELASRGGLVREAVEAEKEDSEK